jgi:gluconolactonase
MKLMGEDQLLITDYRKGLVAVDIKTGATREFLGARNSEGFKGLNDLVFDSRGNLYFTDQGQTGMQDPSGRVYRLGTDDRLDVLLANGPSPNGIVLSPDEKFLFVAMTRGNCVWRMPLMPDGSVSKAGQFFTSYGPSGPDGLAMDSDGRLIVCNPGLGWAWVLNARAEPVELLRTAPGTSLTNVAFGGPERRTAFFTDSTHGRVLKADLNAPGCAVNRREPPLSHRLEFRPPTEAGVKSTFRPPYYTHFDPSQGKHAMPAPGDVAAPPKNKAAKAQAKGAKPAKPQTAAGLLVRCLENEGVKYIFGIPGEENIDVMDALLTSTIKFVTCHHEQGAAFMADVWGRLTGEPGVCMSTLGPGATNLITGYADANMDRAPIVAIAGQGSTARLHKESHQILDLVQLFAPISKYSTQVLTPGHRPEIVRKAFKVAKTEKPGGAFIDFPENIAEMPCDRQAHPGAGRVLAGGADAKVEHRRQADLRCEEPDHPRRQRRDPPGRGRLARELRRGAEDPRGQHVHGQGRDAVHQRALARHHRPQGARPAVVRVREGRRRDLHRLRHGRVPPGHVEPGQRQDHHPRRRDAGRGRRNYIVKVGVLGDIGDRCAASRSRRSRASSSASATSASRSPRPREYSKDKDSR